MHISIGILLFLLVAFTIAACMAIERITWENKPETDQKEEADYWFLMKDWSLKPY